MPHGRLGHRERALHLRARLSPGMTYRGYVRDVRAPYAELAAVEASTKFAAALFAALECRVRCDSGQDVYWYYSDAESSDDFILNSP